MATEFNHQSTADDVLAGMDLSSKRVLVTGGASGIGAETVRAMAAKGAQVIIAARNLDAAGEVKASVVATTGNENIDVMFLELGSLAKIRASAAEFLARYESLDILINNAGIMACPHGQTEDGFELQFGSNHIGHFYFTQKLMPALLKAGSARVIALSSMAHRMSPVVFDDIQYQSRPYEKWQAYGQSKTANILFAVGLNERYADQGVEAFAVHPGAIATPLGRHLAEEEIQALVAANKTSANNPEDEALSGIKTLVQGAATSCYAATAPGLTGKGGVYLEDCDIAQVADDPNFRGGVRDYALDSADADRLWKVTEAMIHPHIQG
jgi:NAD(P)-dependent dehydrogenase (short-subunit alcohol dehydrogenase family)